MNGMIFLLGIYSVLVMVVFPGVILFRVCRWNNPGLFIPAVFGLSLLANYFLVLGLTLVHLYIPWVVRIIGAAEGIAIFCLYWQLFKQKINYAAISQKLALPDGVEGLTRILFYIAWLVVILILIDWIHSWGNVFGAWDPTVWYNRWAIEWSNNQLPSLTWHYPQLLPTNWSLSYVMMGPLPNNIHLEAFAASIQGLFFCGIFYLLLFAFYQQKDQSFLWAIFLISFFMFDYYSPFLMSGYADIPVAFFNFIAIMLFLLETPEQQKSHRFWSLLFALAAAYTKPAGIYTALVIPLLQFYVDHSQKRIGKLLLKYGLLLLLIAPWYIYSSLHETNQYGIKDILFLLFNSVETIQERGMFVLLYGVFPAIFLLFAYAFKDALSIRLKWLLYASTPYYFIWMLFFSYDARNLIFLWPVTCLCISFIFCHEKVFQLLGQEIKKYYFKSYPTWPLPLALILLLVSLNFMPFDRQQNLINMQIQEKNAVYFDPAVMIRLYAYSICPGFQGKIVTDYTFFADVPMLMPYMVSLPNQDYGSNMELSVFESSFDLKAFILAHPGVRYFLLNENYQKLYESDGFKKELQNWLATGRVQLEFSVDRVNLYKIISNS